MTGETNLSVLIKNMQPVLNNGLFVFCSLPAQTAIDFHRIVFFFREQEGVTIVVEKVYADTKGFEYTAVFAWITLHIHSALEAVGLTAAFSNTLADNHISCNVIAGYYHDHIFVQQELGERAVAVLTELAADYCGGDFEPINKETRKQGRPQGSHPTTNFR